MSVQACRSLYAAMTGSSVSRGARSILLMPRTAGLPRRLHLLDRPARRLADLDPTLGPGARLDEHEHRVDLVERGERDLDHAPVERPFARCRPGVSKNAIWAPSPFQIPRIRVRVVCGRGVTMARCSPSTRFRRVDLPTFGRPTMATNPARNGDCVFLLAMEVIAPAPRRRRGGRLEVPCGRLTAARRG